MWQSVNRSHRFQKFEVRDVCDLKLAVDCARLVVEFFRSLLARKAITLLIELLLYCCNPRIQQCNSLPVAVNVGLGDRRAQGNTLLSFFVSDIASDEMVVSCCFGRFKFSLRRCKAFNSTTTPRLQVRKFLLGLCEFVTAVSFLEYHFC
jgi:hypothetical protein